MPLWLEAGLWGLLSGGALVLGAGAILAMLMDTMIPEAFEGAHNHSGLIGATGFLCAFALSVMGT